MFLQRFGVQNFRGINPIGFDLSHKVNIFSGPNGAGKSSILEAIYFLSCCKSFRTTNADALIAYENEWFSLNGIASKEGSGLEHKISVRRVKKQNRAEIDETAIRKASKLSQLLPSLVVCSERQRLFISPPQVRRNFLDWGLFHVKPESINLFTKYERALKQRNAAIKSKAEEKVIKSWDFDLIDSGSEIIKLRSWFVSELVNRLNQTCRPGFKSGEFYIDYETGCGKYDSFSSALEDGFDQDCRYGFTRHGPHRSDFTASYNGHNVKDDFSRGQIKLLVFYLTLSQAYLIGRSKGVNPWLLFDDFASDFSKDLLEVAFDAMLNSGCQVFMTSADDVSNLAKKDSKNYLFHVEHGNVKKMI